MISFVYFFIRKQALIHHFSSMYSAIVIVYYTFSEKADENDYLDWNSRQALR